MIEYLQEYIKNSPKVKEIFGEVDQVSIIKTQNGKGHVSKKVVLYVLINKETIPSFVIYAARIQDTNNNLERGINNLKQNKNLTPKVFLKDFCGDIIFFIVQYLDGIKLDLFNINHLEALINLLIIREKGQYVKLSTFYKNIISEINELNIKIDQDLFEKISNLVIKNDIFLPEIKQHGDFQDNNIFIIGEDVKIIDWDDFGRINFPLFDFTTLYLKLKKYDERIAKDLLKKYFERLQIGLVDEKILKIFYELYNFLRKDYLHDKWEKEEYYQKLICELRKCL